MIKCIGLFKICEQNKQLICPNGKPQKKKSPTKISGYVESGTLGRWTGYVQWAW